jgi:hypothetical protein
MIVGPALWRRAAASPMMELAVAIPRCRPVSVQWTLTAARRSGTPFVPPRRTIAGRAQVTVARPMAHQVAMMRFARAMCAWMTPTVAPTSGMGFAPMRPKIVATVRCYQFVVMVPVTGTRTARVVPTTVERVVAMATAILTWVKIAMSVPGIARTVAATVSVRRALARIVRVAKMIAASAFQMVVAVWHIMARAVAMGQSRHASVQWTVSVARTPGTIFVPPKRWSSAMQTVVASPIVQISSAAKMAVEVVAAIAPPDSFVARRAFVNVHPTARASCAVQMGVAEVVGIAVPGSSATAMGSAFVSQIVLGSSVEMMVVAEAVATAPPGSCATKPAYVRKSVLLTVPANSAVSTVVATVAVPALPDSIASSSSVSRIAFRSVWGKSAATMDVVPVAVIAPMVWNVQWRDSAVTPTPAW